MFLIKKMKFFKRMDNGILLLERQDWLRHNFMESLAADWYIASDLGHRNFDSCLLEPSFCPPTCVVYDKRH